MIETIKQLKWWQIFILGILSIFIYIGMAKLMYTFVSDMSTMTKSVNEMGQAVAFLSRDVKSISNDLNGMSSVLEQGQSDMAQDFKYIRIDLHTVTQTAKIFEKDIANINGDIGEIHSKVNKMSSVTTEIKKETSIMNNSILGVRSDVYKMARPENIIPSNR